MNYVIFTGGDIIVSKLVKDTLENADLIIAADSGATKVIELGYLPNVVVGDMDSIDKKTLKQLKNSNVPCITFPVEKDETDTQLAIEYARDNGALEVVLIGGINGDRIDHIVANILYGAISTIGITYINGMQKSFIFRGPNEVTIAGSKNDYLSLIPLSKDVRGLSTMGLKWELADDVLVFGEPRGVSNVFIEPSIRLSLKKGILFVTHTLQK